MRYPVGFSPLSFRGDGPGLFGDQAVMLDPAVGGEVEG